jgi:hypothetical protein
MSNLGVLYAVDSDQGHLDNGYDLRLIEAGEITEDYLNMEEKQNMLDLTGAKLKHGEIVACTEVSTS